jgi:hypothetical protein
MTNFHSVSTRYALKQGQQAFSEGLNAAKIPAIPELQGPYSRKPGPGVPR